VQVEEGQAEYGGNFHVSEEGNMVKVAMEMLKNQCKTLDMQFVILPYCNEVRCDVSDSHGVHALASIAPSTEVGPDNKNNMLLGYKQMSIIKIPDELCAALEKENEQCIWEFHVGGFFTVTRDMSGE